MVTSQNGYTANDRSLIKTYPVPGAPDVLLPLREGDLAYSLLWAAGRWNAEVEPLHAGWCWGYAERPIRGSTTVLSNHASGTAMDLNAPLHGLGTQPSASMSAAQIAAVHRIIADAHVEGRPVLRWGGDYTGRKDPMHVEVIGSPADVHALVQRLKSGVASPTVPPNRKRVQDWQAILEFAPQRRDGVWGPATDQRSTWMRNAAVFRSGIAHGSRKSTIALIQRIVDVPPDGVYGPATDRGITRWTAQAQRFLGVQVDGQWGANTDKAYQAFRSANLHH